MSKNTSITLGEHFENFIGTQISEGRFGNVSEVVRAGLRLLEDEEAKLRALRSALREGEESGPAVTLNWDDFMTRKHAEHTSR